MFQAAVAFSAIALTCAIHGARAIPASPNAAPVLPASFPISTLNFTTARPPTTLAPSGLHADAADYPPLYAQLYMFEGADCSGTYTYTNLGGILPNACTQNNPFTSVYIQQTISTGTAYAVVVGPRNCPELVEIPGVGVCYNLSGALFEAYAVIE